MKKECSKNIGRGGLIIILFALVILIIYVLTNKSEIRVSENYNSETLSALVCMRYNDVDSFFDNNNAIKEEHKLKILFEEDRVSKISYGFKGEYGTTESAESDNAILHARYNIYMGEHRIDSESLTPIFRIIDNVLSIELYLENYETMNSIIGRMFYIGDRDINIIAEKPIDVIENYYEAKGFLCEMNYQ